MSIETQIKKLQDDVSDIFMLLRSVQNARTLPRTGDESTIDEPIPYTPTRLATVEAKRSGPPAIAKLATYAERLLSACGRAAGISAYDLAQMGLADLVGVRLGDLQKTIEDAKREDAELQHLRRVAETVSEYFVAERMADDAKRSGGARFSTEAVNTACDHARDAKTRIFDLLAAWRNPARPT